MALMRKVGAYTIGIGELNLDPVPFHGASLDPFYRLPGLRQSLATARGHAQGWNGVAQQLYIQLYSGATTFTPLLTGRSGEIRQMIQSAEAAGRGLTAAEMATMVEKLRGLQVHLQQERGRIEQLRTASVDTVRLIAGDYAALTTGSERLDQAIADLDAAVVKEALKYIGPGGQGIYKLIIEEGSKIRKKLADLATSVHALADANAASQKAMQELLAAWMTVDAKFKSVIKTLSESERTTDAFLELPLLLEIAAESWQQLLTYFVGRLSNTVV